MYKISLYTSQWPGPKQRSSYGFSNTRVRRLSISKAITTEQFLIEKKNHISTTLCIPEGCWVLTHNPSALRVGVGAQILMLLYTIKTVIRARWWPSRFFAWWRTPPSTLHGYTVHQIMLNTFYYQLTHTKLKKRRVIKTF